MRRVIESWYFIILLTVAGVLVVQHVKAQPKRWHFVGGAGHVDYWTTNPVVVTTAWRTNWTDHGPVIEYFWQTNILQ